MMRKISFKVIPHALMILGVVIGQQTASAEGRSAQPQQQTQKGNNQGTLETITNDPQDSTSILVISGTGHTTTFTVNGKDLLKDQPIQITTCPGFSVSPSTVQPDAKNATVTVTLNSTEKLTTGQIVLRSGDFRAYVNVKGIGTALPVKDISQAPAYAGGSEAEFVKTVKQGFKPTDKGYTVEFKVNTPNEGAEFSAYAVSSEGVGFKSYVNSGETGLYSSDAKKPIANPETSVEGGLGKFYNEDGHSHIYRYAVTSDKRIFIYRDGLPIDSVRANDYGGQPDFTTETGDPQENLLKNSGFEGEYTTQYDNHMTTSLEGWDILIGDRYNSEQYVKKQEITNKQDFNNHILSMSRYKWADGWSAAEIGQIVNVAPNETYSLSALVRGGIKKEGDLLGKMKIEEVQDKSLGKSVDINSKDWQTYSLDYTTSADCKQLRVFFYLERDKWGADISPLEIDNVKLTGKSRIYSPKIGFDNSAAKIDYFAYDLSGAYAPAISPSINVTVGK